MSRLEDIKKAYGFAYYVGGDRRIIGQDLEWLIEVAEAAKELKEVISSRALHDDVDKATWYALKKALDKP